MHKTLRRTDAHKQHAEDASHRLLCLRPMSPAVNPSHISGVIPPANGPSIVGSPNMSLNTEECNDSTLLCTRKRNLSVATKRRFHPETKGGRRVLGRSLASTRCPRCRRCASRHPFLTRCCSLRRCGDGKDALKRAESCWLEARRRVRVSYVIRTSCGRVALQKIISSLVERAANAISINVRL